MTKKNFRIRWEPYFIQFNDAELVAVQLWVKRMYENGEWYGYCGRITDACVTSAHMAPHRPEC